jgi:hypothetical protein
MQGTKVHAVSNQDQHFDNLLKSVRVPERSRGYWENFPKRVTVQLSGGVGAEATTSAGSLRLWGWGLAGACVALIVGFGLWMESSIATAQPNYTKLYREIESMFPNQIRAIVVESGGVRLELSDKPDIPSSSPLRVDVCHDQQCGTYITFSGQRIRVNAEIWDVLSDGVGHVLVVGPNVVWTSAEPTRRAGVYHIDAQPLRMSS